MRSCCTQGMSRMLLIAAIAVFLTSCQTQRTVRASYDQREIPAATGQGAGQAAGAVLSYADVVDRVAPAVVTIRSSRRVRASQQFPFLNNPLLRQFFGGEGPAPRARDQVEQALGS